MLHSRSGWPVLKPWLMLLLVALTCFAVVYLSPGNTIRAADFPLRHDPVRSVKGSLSVGFSVLWLWISEPLLLVSSMLTPFAVARLRQESTRSYSVTTANIAILVILTITMPIILQFPAWWSMGGWPPARTVDVIYFLFLVCWYMSIAAATLRYLKPDNGQSVIRIRGTTTAVAVILLSVAFSIAAFESKSFQLAINDLLHLARPYHDYLEARYKMIAQAKAKGQAYLTVPDYHQQLPRSIYFNDIMHNPDHWRNVCYADYFGLEKISRHNTPGKTDHSPLNATQFRAR
jgi:hypothetical protein